MRPRDKGTRAETEVVSALVRGGYPLASRAPLTDSVIHKRTPPLPMTSCVRGR